MDTSDRSLSLELFWYTLAEWSRATFGPDSGGPTGALKHLAKEVAECQEKPDDIFEYADCCFLLFDSVRRAGFTYEQLMDAIWKKLAINKKRKWGPRVPGQPVERIREEKSALERAHELMLTSASNLPQLAFDYLHHFCLNNHGYGGNACLTSLAHYAELVEELPAKDPEYAADKDAVAWFCKSQIR
jgi:hypothetical protein